MRVAIKYHTHGGVTVAILRRDGTLRFYHNPNNIWLDWVERWTKKNK